MVRPARSVGAAAVVLVAALAITVAVVLLEASDEVEHEVGVPAAGATSPAPTPAPSTPAPSIPAQSPAATPSGPDLLLPNMRSLDASDLQIEVVGNVRRLRFAASLANLGPGPLLLRPRRAANCPPGQLGARQLLHEDRTGDGRFQRARDQVGQRQGVGCMLDHPGHDHWHFDAMAAYRLRRPGSDDVLVERGKVSFCLRDNERVPNAPVVVPREHFGECTRNGPQGISPGWVDIYTADLDGQWLRLPPQVRSGRLCLELEADPFDLLTETDESDNARTIGLALDGSGVRWAPAVDAACT